MITTQCPCMVNNSYGRETVRRMLQYSNLMTESVGLYCNVECKFQTKGGVVHQPLLVSENKTDCPFVWYQNICSALFGFVTKHACDRQTDGRTDRWTELKSKSNQIKSNSLFCMAAISWIKTCNNKHKTWAKNTPALGLRTKFWHTVWNTRVMIPLSSS